MSLIRNSDMINRYAIVWCLGGICSLDWLDPYAVGPQVLSRVLLKGKGIGHGL